MPTTDSSLDSSEVLSMDASNADPGTLPLRVGYDAQAFLSPNGGTGKGVQLRNLIGPFLDQFIGFASTEPNPSGLPLIQEGAKGHTLWQQFSLPSSLRRHSIDLFLAPANVAPFYLHRSIDLVLVLHDTIHMMEFRKPDWKGRLWDQYRRWQIPASVRRARVVLTVSEYSRGEILRMFPKADVRVIPCTIGEAWFDPKPLKDRDGYILMVTSSAPHKNAPAALRGYAEYARRAGASAKPLRIVGLAKAAGQYREELAREGVADLVAFLPFLSEQQLIAAYRDAAALLFPSLSEGFGVPMLEAMATGTPIIASRAASLPEVGGDAACYFSPHDHKDIADSLYQVLSNEPLREEMARKGLNRVQDFAPGRVRKQVIAFWREIAGLPPLSSGATD